MGASDHENDDATDTSVPVLLRTYVVEEAVTDTVTVRREVIRVERAEQP